MTRKLNDYSIEKLKSWEGLRLESYADSAGVATIGYGSTYYENGNPVKLGQIITKERADRLFSDTLKKYCKAVEESVTVDLNDNQFGALVSLCYNIGINNFKKSTLLKKLNSGDYDAVPQELSKWVYAGGKKIKGLVNRRSAEAGLWVTGDFVTSSNETASPPNVWNAYPFLAPFASGISGLFSMISDSIIIQSALAFVMVISVLYIIYNNYKERKG